MLFRLFTLSTLLLTTSLWSQEDAAQREIYVQNKERFNFIDNYKDITLKGAIEQALRLNHSQEIRKLNREKIDLALEDTKSSFWLPQFKLQLSTDNQRIGRLRAGSRDGTSSTDSMGTLSLGFEDYTVFNWGIDYLRYLNNVEQFQRQKTVLTEDERTLKHSVIIKFFEIYKYREIEKIKKTQLRHASYIYRLNREKVKIRKVSKQDYLQSRTEFLRAQKEFYLARKDSQIVDEEMANLIHDPNGTRYVFGESLNYTKLGVNLEDAIKMAKKKNPNVLNAKNSLEAAKKNYEITAREDLPLPKLSINLGAYKHTLGDDHNRIRYETQAGDSNIDLIASINASWTIWGEDGFLNSRKKARSLVDKYISQKSLEKSRFDVSISIKKFFRQLLNYQNDLEILNAQIISLRKLYDTVLEKYVARKTSFVTLATTLRDLTQAEVELSQTYYLHTKAKVLLAQTMGVDDFIGENFEDLAKREKMK